MIESLSHKKYWQTRESYKDTKYKVLNELPKKSKTNITKSRLSLQVTNEKATKQIIEVRHVKNNWEAYMQLLYVRSCSCNY